MVFRKLKQNTGFSLIEVMVAITILGFVIVPIGSSLVLSFRLNARSEQNLQAQLAVSSAVETIMAEGFDTTPGYYDGRFEDVEIETESDKESDVACYFTVTARDFEDISVTTYARWKGGDTT